MTSTRIRSGGCGSPASSAAAASTWTSAPDHTPADPVTVCPTTNDPPIDGAVLSAGFTAAGANETTAVAIQIETAGGLNALAEIAAERAIDLLFVGPNDLSQALGVAGQYGDPRYRAAVERVGAVAGQAGKAAGIMLRQPDQIPALAAQGYRVFTTSDRTLLLQSARDWRSALSS